MFIDYMSQPEIQAKLARKVGTAPTVDRASTDLSDAEFNAVSSTIAPILPRYDLYTETRRLGESTLDGDDHRLMRQHPPRGVSDYVVAVYPVLMLGIFFVIPFTIMLAVSFAHRVPGGFYEPGFEWGSYARFITPFFFKILGFSITVSAAVALLCVTIGLPFTYLLTRMRRSHTNLLAGIYFIGVIVIRSDYWLFLVDTAVTHSRTQQCAGLARSVADSNGLGTGFERFVTGSELRHVSIHRIGFIPRLSTTRSTFIGSRAHPGSITAQNFFYGGHPCTAPCDQCGFGHRVCIHPGRLLIATAFG